MLKEPIESRGVDTRDLVAGLLVKLKPYLLAGVAASGDNGDTADLEELHFVLLCCVCWAVIWRSRRSSFRGRREIWW